MGNATDIDVWMQELCTEACTTVQVYVPLVPQPKEEVVHVPVTAAPMFYAVEAL